MWGRCHYHGRGGGDGRRADHAPSKIFRHFWRGGGGGGRATTLGLGRCGPSQFDISGKCLADTPGGSGGSGHVVQAKEGKGSGAGRCLVALNTDTEEQAYGKAPQAVVLSSEVFTAIPL